MRDRGIGSWPARRIRMTPDKLVFSDATGEVTYAQFDDRVTRLAHGLRALGVQRGDRVAYLGPNATSFAEALFATARLGAVYLPMNTRLSPPETAYILGDAEPKLVIWAPPHGELVDAPEIRDLGIPLVAVAPRTPEERSYASLFATGDVERIDESVSLDDLMMIQYTSGTSGRPKGVMLTHGNVTWNTYNTLIDADLTSNEVALISAPLFHTAALDQQLMTIFVKGGTMLLEPTWDPDRVLQLIEKHRITMLFGVTTMYLSLLQAPAWESSDLSSLSTLMCGGAPVPEMLLRDYAKRGLIIAQAYGMTESAPGATYLRTGRALEKIGSAGTSCYWTDVRVVDGAFADSPVGEAGEILIQGPNVTPGYWRNPEATASTFVEDGWLRSGDLAKKDADGFIYIVDRLKDMIISGGENVYPAEVEAAIYENDAVAECAVIGVPDPKWGELGRAVVVLKPGRTATPESILSGLDGILARYKIPRSAVIVDELPHNASGKLLRREVKESHGQA